MTSFRICIILNYQENIRHDLISWVAPNQEDIALNYDDAVVHTGNVAAYGEVARGYTCEFIYGFGAKLKGCLVLETKLWGILIGMKMVWARGFRRITVQANFLNAINLM